MLLGIWKNVEDLEESLNLPELELVVTQAREREMRHNRFMAAIQGIDIDKDSEDSAKRRVEEMKQRVAAEKAGVSQDHFEMGLFGLDVEIEE